jgi:hypothetical protein
VDVVLKKQDYIHKGKIRYHFFRYDEKNNVLFANKLTKEKKIGHYGKRNQFVAEYLDCVKVTLDTNFKLKDAIKLFRELSAAKMIETLANDKSNNAGKNNLCGGKDAIYHLKLLENSHGNI